MAVLGRGACSMEAQLLDIHPKAGLPHLHINSRGSTQQRVLSAQKRSSVVTYSKHHPTRSPQNVKHKQTDSMQGGSAAC